jgi:hypothetical protein
MPETLIKVETRCTKCGSPLKEQEVIQFDQGPYDHRLERPTWQVTYRCRCCRRGRREW